MRNLDLTSGTLVRSVRVLALLVMIGGCIGFVRANDAESHAIFRAGGDAGMWALGVFSAFLLLVPGAVLLLIALVMNPRRKASARMAALAGFAVLGPAGLLAVNLYPPDKETAEGRPLRPALWDHAADLYLLALLLLGAAGALLILSAFLRVDPAGTRSGVMVDPDEPRRGARSGG